MAVDAKNVETAIRHLIEAWASAVRARDISGVIAYHTDDVLMFDVPLPVAVRGIAAYRETWPNFFDALVEGEAAFDIAELNITAGDRVAFATALLRYGRQKSWLRTTHRRLRLVSHGDLHLVAPSGYA